MKNYLEIALQYHDAGLVVIPWDVWEDGSAKFSTGWKKYQFGQTKDQVRKLFEKDCHGIALICTNGIEVIDIDVKADPKKTIAKDFFEDVAYTYGSDELLSKCVVVKTKSKGWHVLYKTGIAQGNTKLARRAGCSEASIETRGPGGLVFIAPSPGYHVRFGDYTDMPILSDDERNLLINIAKAQNEEPEMERAVLPKPKPDEKPVDDLSPGDDFDQKNDVLTLLEQAGWNQTGRAPSGKIYLSKPDASKKRDTHASILTAKDGTPIFWPFTTATNFEAEKGYGPFAVYAYLNHGGDFKAAAKALYDQGYGSRRKAKEEPKQDQDAPKKEDKKDIIAFVRSTRFDITKPIREEEAILTVDIDGKKYKVGGRGQMGVVVGEQKSGKSLVTSCIAASGLSKGKQVLNFSLNLEKGMEYFDTEQSAFFYQLTQKRLYDLAGLDKNHPNYAAYLLRRLPIKDRVAAIEEMLQDRKDLSCIIIDGAVDLCTNFNDERASIETADKLLQWSDQTGAMLLTVLHVTKSMGYLRGHLGTALQNKADFVIQAKQDKSEGVYTVECRESRFAPFPSFEFTRDDRGFPVIDGQESIPDNWMDDEPAPAITTIPAQRANDSIIPF